MGWIPRFRFSVRRLMIAVAVVGLISGSEELRRRSIRLAEIAQDHRDEMFGHRCGSAPMDRTDNRVREVLERESIQMEFHRRLAEKYQRAARYPWLNVEPDPPGPK